MVVERELGGPEASAASEHSPRCGLLSLALHISGACTLLDESDSIEGVVDETADGYETGGGIGGQDIEAGREVGRVVVRSKEGRVDGEGMMRFLEGSG